MDAHTVSMFIFFSLSTIKTRKVSSIFDDALLLEIVHRTVTIAIEITSNAPY